DPKNYTEAMNSDHAADWSKAMAEEISALEANNTWEIEYGVDYVDTFSAALEGLSVRIVLALSRKYNVPARHGDVPNAYV
ncbi:hypothetical protein PHYSODRAFT_416072, partial [Phytophthora sojae]